MASPCCPQCRSKRIWKDGLRYHGDQAVQRFLCRACGYRFSEPDVKVHVAAEPTELLNPSADLTEEMVGDGEVSLEERLNSRFLFRSKNVRSQGSKPHITNLGKGLNNFPSYNSDCRVCDSERGSKNLATVETAKDRLAGATLDAKGKLVEFAWYLKKKGRSEATIRTYSSYLDIIQKQNINLLDAEAVKEFISEHFKDRNTKHLVVCAYDAFLKFLGGTWDKPEYKKEHRQAFIPTDEELQIAVNTGFRKTIVFNSLLYETGARCNEAERLEWTDLDAERCKVTIKASKDGSSRTLTVSRKLMNMLLSLPRTNKTVFPPLLTGSRRSNFWKKMQMLARIHDNPRFLKIHFHTFRHCKALREYHKTKNMQHVKKVLGHKSILTTQIYVELYTEIYGDLKPEDYTCEIASSVEEAKKLIEAGFEYVCELDGEKLFRKVK